SWQPWGFDADVFNLCNSFRCSHGQNFMTTLRDEHVVLNTNTDATELWCDRVRDLLRLLLLCSFELSCCSHAQSISSLPSLDFTIFAQIICRRLPFRSNIQPRLDGQDHPRLKHARLTVDAIVTDIVDVHAKPVSRTVHIELAVMVHRERLLDTQREEVERH